MTITPDELRKHLDRPDLAFVGGLGLEMLEIKEGYAEGKIPVTKACGNPIGSVHGAALFALADNVAGSAAVSTGAAVTTASCSFHFLNAATDAKELICRASVIKNGGRLCVLEARIFDEKEKLLCTATLEYAKIGTAEELMSSVR